MRNWDDNRAVDRRWRAYRTSLGYEPVRDFLRGLTNDDRRAVLAAMKTVRDEGLHTAGHLRGSIYEVRADGRDSAYRVLFAPQGKRSQVLLGLVGHDKKTQKMPSHVITLAERRLRDWERRGHTAKGRSL